MTSPSAFEWDQTRSDANEARRGIPFEAAIEVFLDESRIEEADTRQTYGEDRVNIIGCVDGVVLHVTYTMRGDVCRIISVRRASRKERRRYGHRS